MGKDDILNECVVLCVIAQLYLILCDPMDCILPGFLVHGDSPGKNTGVIAMPSSRGSSQPRDGTQVFHISGRFFTIWAMLCQLYIIRGKMNFYLSLTLNRKINSKWIIDLNVSDTTLMLLEEYVKRITFWVFFQGWQSFLKQSSSHKEEKNKLD